MLKLQSPPNNHAEGSAPATGSLRDECTLLRTLKLLETRLITSAALQSARKAAGGTAVSSSSWLACKKVITVRQKCRDAMVGRKPLQLLGTAAAAGMLCSHHRGESWDSWGAMRCTALAIHICSTLHPKS